MYSLLLFTICCYIYRTNSQLANHRPHLLSTYLAAWQDIMVTWTNWGTQVLYLPFLVENDLKRAVQGYFVMRD